MFDWLKVCKIGLTVWLCQMKCNKKNLKNTTTACQMQACWHLICAKNVNRNWWKWFWSMPDTNVHGLSMFIVVLSVVYYCLWLKLFVIALAFSIGISHSIETPFFLPFSIQSLTAYCYSNTYQSSMSVTHRR